VKTATPAITPGQMAHITQCPYCINGHTKAALRAGTTPEEWLIWSVAPGD